MALGRAHSLISACGLLSFARGSTRGRPDTWIESVFHERTGSAGKIMVPERIQSGTRSPAASRAIQVLHRPRRGAANLVRYSTTATSSCNLEQRQGWVHKDVRRDVAIGGWVDLT